jgi:hypothetical protein
MARRSASVGRRHPRDVARAPCTPKPRNTTPTPIGTSPTLPSAALAKPPYTRFVAPSPKSTTVASVHLMHRALGSTGLDGGGARSPIEQLSVNAANPRALPLIRNRYHGSHRHCPRAHGSGSRAGEPARRDPPGQLSEPTTAGWGSARTRIESSEREIDPATAQRRARCRHRRSTGARKKNQPAEALPPTG